MICCAFWFGEVRSIVVAYNLTMLVLSGQYIPIRLFPEPIIEFMEMTPFIYLVDFPVSIATGNLPLNFWFPKMGLAMFWCIVVTCVGRMIYRSGIRVYGGFGA